MAEIQQILAELTQIFHEVFFDDFDLTMQTTAGDIDGWDSLNHIRLMVTVEKRFKIKFNTAEIGSLNNVGDLVQLIKTKIESK